MMTSSSFIIPKLPKYFSSVGGRSQLLASFSSLSPPSSTHKRKLSSQNNNNNNLASSQSWSEEWKSLGLGARLPKPGSRLTNLMFVQMGFGVDQHGNDGSSGSGGGATQASVRAVRNAIEFNSIPGIIEAVPGGRSEMLISVKLGIPLKRENSSEPMEVNLNEVAKVFPYGRLMPIQTVVGGLTFNTGRIVRELGDVDDLAVCVAACVSIGYDSGERGGEEIHAMHDTKDGN
uniref:Uncharacterized protein n=1 Tax=Skeletonema marinoi TaxID=267567 RepID=A0A7S2KTB3_9STRA|mmetsp:Transcript_16039/g.27086  ORF Transcript_16039/g.27086 Transcript_16039/m.27086 type:complete len:232 (+) Transcript_16039:115-810(+)